jgi:uncharacterized membrane protein (GlpM family)
VYRAGDGQIFKNTAIVFGVWHAFQATVGLAGSKSRKIYQLRATAWFSFLTATKSIYLVFIRNLFHFDDHMKDMLTIVAGLSVVMWVCSKFLIYETRKA